MLLGEVFDGVKLIKKAWVRKNGQLTKVDVPAKPAYQPLPPAHPMFPIKKPRYDSND